MSAIAQARATATGPVCPECGGDGIVPVNGEYDRTTGIWICDEASCEVCDGTGLLPDDYLICESEEPHAFDVDHQACHHGRDLCPEHVFACKVCAAEDRL